MEVYELDSENEEEGNRVDDLDLALTENSNDPVCLVIQAMKVERAKL